MLMTQMDVSISIQISDWSEVCVCFYQVRTASLWGTKIKSTSYLDETNCLYKTTAATACAVNHTINLFDIMRKETLNHTEIYKISPRLFGLSNNILPTLSLSIYKSFCTILFKLNKPV